MVIPTGTNLTENMVILMDRADGDVNSTFSYLVQFNINNGTIEFLTRGASGAYTNTLIAHPYLDRWYHVAVSSILEFTISQPVVKLKSQFR